jgi:hypothetical protein
MGQGHILLGQVTDDVSILIDPVQSPSVLSASNETFSLGELAKSLRKKRSMK